MHLLFVCLGNICRSPTAEAVMADLARREGRHDIVVDSAGTAAWHVGKGPDRRSVAAAARRGITVAGAARQVTAADFAAFDLLLAADHDNLAELHRLAAGDEERRRAVLLRSFDHVSVAAGTLAVPDPYYGGASGFDEVLDIVQAACEGLLAAHPR